MLELLSPAKNMSSIKAAVSNGANAVYLSIGQFNARAKLNEINLDNISQVVEYCHLHNVKVYVTLNTLIKNNEFDTVLNIVDQLITAKVDAYIIQDLGLAHVLINTYKNIVLHASTQMGVHNLYGAKMLEQMGFKRVVLARETTLDDIKAIHNGTKLEIEYFVQGALCVAFSGNCYFSSLNNGHSGNRGECLQLCRMCYKAGNKDGYFLSPKDLCLVDKLQTLIEAGVSSFKIEGRMKRESYVALTTKVYRAALDNKEYDKNSLYKVFNRGKFNEGNYLYNDNADIINPHWPNHRGQKIGKVLDVKPFKDIYKIKLKSTYPLSTDDAIQTNSKSVAIGNIETNGDIYTIYSKEKLNAGDDIYLTLDKSYEDSLLNTDDKLALDLNVNIQSQQPITVIASCQNVKVKYVSPFVCDTAINKPLTTEDVAKAFARLKNTDFTLNNIDINVHNAFVKNSALSQVKNDVIAMLRNKMLDNYKTPTITKLNAKVVPYEFTPNNSLSISSANIDDELIFSPEKYSVKTIQDFYQSKRPKKRFYLELPIIANNSDLNLISDMLNSLGIDKVGVIANNIYGLYFKSLGYDVIAGPFLNTINNYTTAYLKTLNITRYVRSVEKNLTSSLRGGYAYSGYVPLMTLVHCPYKTVYNCTCDKCAYNGKLAYTMGKNTYAIKRYQISKCYFKLLSPQKILSSNSHFYEI